VRIGLLVTIGVGLCPILAPAAQAQDCPDVQTSRARLLEFRTQKAQRLAQLQEIEAAGPRTLEDQDRLNHLRTERPAEIAAQLDQFRRDQSAKRTRMLAERNQKIADIARQRNQLSARNGAELAAQQAKYNDLIAKGAQTADLEAQARAAAPREAELINEKQVVLAQLHSGKFCSQCGRSAFEIEKSGSETFEQHLISVNGQAVMKPEKIQERSDDYDQKIQQARQQHQQIQANLAKARGDHATAVNTALAAITRLKVDGPAAIANFEQQLQSTVAKSDLVLATVDSELKAGNERFAQMEVDRGNEERALDAAIASRGTDHEQKVGELRTALSQVEAEEAPLKAEFLQAASQCRAVVIQSQQTAAEQDHQRRKNYAVAQQQFVDTSYQDTVRREAERRTNLDAGQAPPLTKANAIVAGVESAARQASGTLQAARREWKNGLGLRESGYYRELDPSVRAKIDANIESFTSARNTSREVLRDYIGRVRSGSTMALLRNAMGQGNGVAPDLAAAAETPRPSLLGTIRSKVMPTIEAMAIETAVDSRERQSGRSFDPQERVAERGYVKAMYYITNPKKAGEAMIETYNETVDTFMANSKKSFGDDN
jgi:hypothetical protein